MTFGIKGSLVADTCKQTYKCLLGTFDVMLCFLLYKLQLSCYLEIRSHYLAQACFKRDSPAPSFPNAGVIGVGQRVRLQISSYFADSLLKNCY